MEIRPIFSAIIRSKTGAVLMASQVAITMAVLSNALFLLNTRLTVMSRPSGVVEEEVFVLRLAATEEIEDPEAMQRHDLALLRAIPGVVRATETNQVPLGRSGSTTTLNIDAATTRSAQASMFLSGGPLVDTLGLEIVEGRDFLRDEIRRIDPRNMGPQADAVIVSRALADEMFGVGTPAVGKVVHHSDRAALSHLRIVGVVETLTTPQAASDPSAYRTFIMPVQLLVGSVNYVVRTNAHDQGRVMTAAEQKLGMLRNDRVVVSTRTMEELRELRYRGEKTGAGMLLIIALGLLLVTASGIVGVASLWVNHRTRQIGVRRALGARRLDIMRYFLTENLIISTVGITFGVGLALSLNHFLASSLTLARLPTGYVVGGAVILWTLGAVAVLGPAWRASTVSPGIATRSV